MSTAESIFTKSYSAKPMERIRKQRESFAVVTPQLFKESEAKASVMSVMKANANQIREGTGMHPKQESNNSLESKYCLNCFTVKRLWMVTVNMYDIMGLLDICPCGTLHSIRPYISYKIKTR